MKTLLTRSDFAFKLQAALFRKYYARPGLLTRTPVTILFADNYSDLPHEPDEDLGREFGFSMKI
jgi:hypothetical protein